MEESRPRLEPAGCFGVNEDMGSRDTSLAGSRGALGGKKGQEGALGSD